jgi:hypothetical protein
MGITPALWRYLGDAGIAKGFKTCPTGGRFWGDTAIAPNQVVPRTSSIFPLHTDTVVGLSTIPAVRADNGDTFFSHAFSAFLVTVWICQLTNLSIEFGSNRAAFNCASFLEYQRIDIVQSILSAWATRDQDFLEGALARMYG